MVTQIPGHYGSVYTCLQNSVHPVSTNGIFSAKALNQIVY